MFKFLTIINRLLGQPQAHRGYYRILQPVKKLAVIIICSGKFLNTTFCYFWSLSSYHINLIIYIPIE